MARSKKSSEKKEDALAHVRKLLTDTLAREDVQENRKLYVEDSKFADGNSDNGWQWPDQIWKDRKIPGKARPCLTINKTQEFINQVVNDARQNRPQAKVLPVDDSADIETAEVFNGLIRNIEHQSDADNAYDQGVKCSVTGGFGYWRYVTEYVDDKTLDQEIRVLAINNPLCVIDDPDIQTPEGSDRKWALIVEKIKKDDYDDNYGKDHPIDWSEAASAAYAGWVEEGYCVVAEYWRYEEAEEEITVGGKTRKVTKRKTVCTKTNGVEEWDRKEWAGKYIPLVRVAGNISYIEGKAHISGLVRNKKDPQRMYNYMSSAEAEVFALQPKAPFVGPKEAFEGHEEDWKVANTENLSHLAYNHRDDAGDEIPRPERAQPPAGSQAIIQIKLAAAEDLKSTSGQYSASLGQQSNETSGKAILARQREGDTATFHYIDNLSKAQRFGAKVMIDAIPYYYDTKRVVRIIGEDGTPEMAQLDPDSQVSPKEVKKAERIYNLSAGRYDVAVTVGPSYTTRRQESAAVMQELTRANPNLMGVIGDIMLRALDVPYADEMAQRMKKSMPPELVEEEDDEIPAAAKAQMQAMQAENAQLAQALEGMMNDADLLKKQAEIKKAGVDEQKIQADAVATQANQALEREKLGLEHRRLDIDETKTKTEYIKTIQEAEAQGMAVDAEGNVVPIIPILEGLAQGMQEQNQMLMQAMIQLQQGLQQVAQIAAAPRKSTFVTDENGQEAAVSQVVLQ